MTPTQIAERKRLYRMIRNLSDDKAARVMGYIKSMESPDDEPALTEDEEEGLRTANRELLNGGGRSFKSALKDLW
jgi:hypothetical protein